MKSKDWIALIEAGYHLEGSEESWLNNVLEQAAPLFDRGFWPCLCTYRFTATTTNIEHVVSQAPFKHITKATPETVDYVFRSGKTISTMSDLIFSHCPKERTAFLRNTFGIFRDGLGIKAFSGTGKGLGFFLCLLKTSTSTVLERRRWPLMASHLGAGLRLRALTASITLDAKPVEGILDASGKLFDARDRAMETSAREALREAVRRIDHIRTRAGRSDPDAAMEAWEGLVEGRWSLVDHFDTDRRRFVVAIKNDPTYPDPRGLTMRERQVAEFVGLGHSCKEISYTLGVSQSAVTNCTARAQNKLGLSSLPELVAFFAPSGLRTKLAEVAIQEENLLVGAYPLIDESRIEELTRAERAVLAHLMAGSTNSDIAQRRKTSAYTVANQVQTIFQKLHVSSRSELAACLQNVV